MLPSCLRCSVNFHGTQNQMQTSQRLANPTWVVLDWKRPRWAWRGPVTTSRDNLWLSQLEEGRVLVSSGRRSNVLPYVLQCTGQLHMQELSSPKCQQHWGWETLLPGLAALFPPHLHLMLPSYHQPNPPHLLLLGSSKLPVSSSPPHSLCANSAFRLKCLPWYLHGWASLVAQW